MKKKGFLTEMIALICIFFLILNEKNALLAARDGVILCIRTVIPSLLPFFFLTTLLAGSLNERKMPLLSGMNAFLGLPQGFETLLVPAFLGGYPMGAKVLGDQYRKGILSKEDAEHLLLFCSNAGPAFFFGMLLPCLKSPSMVLVLWGIHTGTALLISYLSPIPKSICLQNTGERITAADAMESAVKAMAVVCGWIICFRILSSSLDQWLLWRFPQWIRAMIKGLMELTGGCAELNGLSSMEQKFLLAAFLSGFGGLAVTMQTVSVLNGLSPVSYIKGKVLQSLLSLLMAFMVIRGLYPGVIALVLLAVLLKGKLQKRSGKKAAFSV